MPVAALCAAGNAIAEIGICEGSGIERKCRGRRRPEAAAERAWRKMQNSTSE